MEIGNATSPRGEEVLPPVSANENQSPSRPEKFVTFHLGEAIYAIQAAAVAEVSQILPLTPLPGGNPCMLGLSPLRGDVVAKIDLRAMFGEGPTNSGNPKAKEIILKQPGAGITPVAFAVDRLGEIATLDVVQIRPTANNNELFFGEVTYNERPLKVVDYRKLLASIEPD